jgi:DNA-3-methyladenine glycosylase II
LVRSIVFQQLSGKAARTIMQRLVNALPEGRLTPEAILALTPEQMRSLGLSGQKTAYVRDLAERTRSGEIDFSKFPAMSDDEVIEHLTRVKGVGVWTAHMFLIFALRRPDVLPTGDLGVRAAMRKAYRMRALPKPERMEKIAKRWRPYCSVASWYLWRSLDGPAEI